MAQTSFTRAATSAPPLDNLLAVVKAARALLSDMDEWPDTPSRLFAAERVNLRNALEALDAQS